MDGSGLAAARRMRGNESNPETGNGQRATGNGSPLIENGQRATGNGHWSANQMRIGANIAERLLAFAAATLAIVKTLPKDAAGKHVTSQLFRAATAGGANYEEARAAESKPDFIHKLGIALKELRETIFWLRLIETSSLSTAPTVSVIAEAHELVAILSASIRTARARLEQQ